MKISITGSAGLIGSALKQALEKLSIFCSGLDIKHELDHPAQNGIFNRMEGLREMSHSIMDKIPENTGFMGILNPSHGPFDLDRTRMELMKIDTPIVCATRQLLAAIAESLDRVNSGLLWLHVPHSEGGAIYARAYEGMTQEQQKKVRSHILISALAPALPIPKAYAKEAQNIWSNHDGITGQFGNAFKQNPDYDIIFVEAKSKRSTLLTPITEHFFMSGTYQSALTNEIDSHRSNYGFYIENTR